MKHDPRSPLAQQLHHIPHPRCLLLPTIRLLAKRLTHQLSLLRLNAQDLLLNTPLHHQPPDGTGPRLTQPMHAVDRLILNSRRPPRVREDDGVGSNEIQADTGDGQTREQDAAVRVDVERVQAGVACFGIHGAVDAREGVAGSDELRLDDAEEGAPLREDDDFGVRIAAAGGEDLHERFGFGGFRLDVDFGIGVRELGDGD